MPAFVVVDIEVLNPVEYEDYKKQAEAAVKLFGGRYLVRGGEHRTLEGDWRPKRLVILEFPDRETALRWHDSAEYAPALALRRKTARTDMVLVDAC